MRQVVILGAGQAGFEAAASLREQGYGGRLSLVGDEPHPPYERPPLSKTFLAGTAQSGSLYLRPTEYFADHDIDLLLGDPAGEIDRQRRKVILRSGRRLDYDHLILATGARNRLLPVDGADLEGVAYLRTLEEASALRERLADARNVVIVGAGFIGLELAAVAGELGKSVHVLEAMPRVMSRAVAPCVSTLCTELHQAWGTEIWLGSRVSKLVGTRGRVRDVEVAGGLRLPADLVIIGVGVVPNAEIAAAANLPINDGILVDTRLLTVDANISAIGDCATFMSLRAGRPIRLESVQNAVDQARCVAARLLGAASDYDALPWFWSDQGELKLQMVGLTAGCDETVVRGDPAATGLASGGTSVFCFRAGRFVGVEAINRPADFVLGRQVLSTGSQLSPQQAADPDFDLKAYRAAGAQAETV